MRSGTTWSEQAHLFASDAAEDEHFGWSVAISGGTAVVGAPSDSFATGGCGSAYVFVRSGATWSQQAHLLASDAARRLISALPWRSAATRPWSALIAWVKAEAGSAYVFVRSGTTWSEQAHLFASDGAEGDIFGASVAISGDTAAVGAPFDNTAEGVQAGSAYVYRLGSSVTISSAPSGLSFTVSGTGCDPGSYATPKALNWSPGSSCTVEFSTPQTGSSPGTRHVFTGWADGLTTNPRTFTVPTAPTTYTANFNTQYQLTTLASPGGGDGLRIRLP